MTTLQRTRPMLKDRLEFVLTSEQKRKAIEVADREQLSVGAIVRRALTQFLENQAA